MDYVWLIVIILVWMEGVLEWVFFVDIKKWCLCENWDFLVGELLDLFIVWERDIWSFFDLVDGL